MEWVTYKLSDITKQIVDGKHGGCTSEDHSGFYFASVKDIVSLELQYDQMMQIPENEFNEIYKRTSLENGDTIYANTGDTIGKSVFIKNNLNAERTAFQKSIAVVKPDKSFVDPAFLYYLLANETKGLRLAASGSGQKNLLLDTMRNYEVLIPECISDQRRISKPLELIDDKIKNNIHISKQLESLAITIYDYWFVQFDFPDENGKPYKSSGDKMVWNAELKREIPEGWEVRPLGDILSFSKGRRPDELSDKPKGDLNSPYITIDVANNGFPQFCDPKSMVQCKGEVIMVMDGAASGDVYLGNEGSLGSTFSMLPSKRKDISNALIYMMLTGNAVIYKRANTGSTVPHANRSFIEKMKIAMPKDASYFSRQFDVLFEEIIGIKRENQQLASLRDFLLPMLMNGQVKVK